MKSNFLFLIGFILGCMNGYASDNARPEKEKDLKVIVFDFGKVVGGTDREILARNIGQALNISQDEALHLIQGYKVRHGSRKAFWKSYAQNQKMLFPDNWSTRFKALRLASITVDNEVVDVVKELRARGYRMAMLSNTTPKRAEQIRSLGGYDLFDPVVLSCEAGVSKPHEGAFRLLLERVEALPEECLFIDDNPKNIHAAEKLGFKVLLFSSSEQLKAELEKRSILSSEGNVSGDESL